MLSKESTPEPLVKQYCLKTSPNFPILNTHSSSPLPASPPRVINHRYYFCISLQIFFHKLTFFSFQFFEVGRTHHVAQGGHKLPITFLPKLFGMLVTSYKHKQTCVYTYIHTYTCTYIHLYADRVSTHLFFHGTWICVISMLSRPTPTLSPLQIYCILWWGGTGSM